MRIRSLFASIGAVALAAGAPVVAGTSSVAAALPAVHPYSAQAPDSAFVASAGRDLPGVACRRPEPDNRVSTTIHCYRPDELRSFYGLGPLATSNEGAGQTIVLVDAYGSPTAEHDVDFFAQTFGGPVPDFEAAFPLGSPDYSTATGNGVGQSGPTAADGWAGEANLDVQWAYAMAPKAHLVLLATPPAETQGVQGLPNLMKAIDWAVVRYPAGTVFSMSFGTSEQAFGSAAAARSQFAITTTAGVRGQVRPEPVARASSTTTVPSTTSRAAANSAPSRFSGRRRPLTTP